LTQYQGVTVTDRQTDRLADLGYCATAIVQRSIT